MTETEDYDKSATPTAHAESHQDGGDDEITVQDLAGELAAEQKSDWNKVADKPATFPPSAHKASHQDGGADEINVTNLSGILNEEQKSSWGQVSGKPAAFPPQLHHADHEAGNADEIDVAGLAGELADNQKSTFSKLSDTPAIVPGLANRAVKINAASDALEFAVADPDDHSGRHEHGEPDEIIIANVTASAPYVVTAQGDIVYASAAHILARLARGASNHMSLFMNAAGTIPEWALGVKMTGHTYDMATPSGNQTLAGAGFTPSVAILLFGIPDVAVGMGMADGTNNYVIHYDAAYDNDPQFSVSNCIHAYTSAGNRAWASMTFNADGGVLAWTKSLNPVGTMTFAVVWIR